MLRTFCPEGIAFVWEVFANTSVTEEEAQAVPSQPKEPRVSEWRGLDDALVANSVRGGAIGVSSLSKIEKGSSSREKREINV